MKVGDLIRKVHGYGPENGHWTGVVIGFVMEKTPYAENIEKVLVLSDGVVEKWIKQFCEVFHESW